MKKRLFVGTIGILLIVKLCGCGGKADNSAPADKAAELKDFAEAAEESDKKPEVPDNNLNEEKEDAKIGLDSEKAIISFLAGDWTLLDCDTGDDCGKLSIKEDGTFVYLRLSDNVSGRGELSFGHSMASEKEEPDEFRMEFDSIEEFAPGVEFYSDYGSAESTSGIFHIGCSESVDYLYLKEIGNGDSAVSMYVFNIDADMGEREYLLNKWLFYRDSGGRNVGKLKKDESFYAWAWERDKGENGTGVLLQPMNVHEYETYEDYTNRKFTGGYFGETGDIGIVHYELSADADLNGIFATREWNSGYPLMMCNVSVDEDGIITRLSDVDLSLYNIYDMGELKPEFSYHDMTFIIEGYEIDMHEFAPAATAITDCIMAGDWIIVECHVNPNMNVYEFYNINDGIMDYFEYEIDGTNLIWQGDDLSTAVYTKYNEIYDFWGNQIGYVRDGEIYELAFIDETTVGARCRIIDEIGQELEFTEKYEYEPHDRAAFLYYEYMLGGSRQWKKLMEDAPKDAVALVMVNPPDKMLSRLSYSDVYGEGGLDTVVVVSLTDGQRVFIEPSEPNESPNAWVRGGDHYVDKGDAAVFDVTVPEGISTETLVVHTTGNGEVLWNISQLSGRIPQMSTFLTNGR